MYLNGRNCLVTGGHGFLGRVLVRKLKDIGANVITPTRQWCDLTNQQQTLDAFEEIRGHIDYVFHLAANVGGIAVTKQFPGRSFYQNAQMGLNVIEAAREFEVGRVIVAGSVCAYPLRTPIPMDESNLWEGPPEPTNGPYGVAKRVLATMLDAYRQQYGMESAYLLMANLYGPGDNFDPATSHVIPAMIRKFTEAEQNGDPSVTFWGTGRASRDFLYVDDAADAFVAAALAPAEAIVDPINIGAGTETPIYGLSELIRAETGYPGEVHWDTTKPDGQPRRRLNIWRAEDRLGWKPTTKLEDGVRCAVDWWKGKV